MPSAAQRRAASTAKRTFAVLDWPYAWNASYGRRSKLTSSKSTAEGQREVAEVVRRELQLPPLRGTGLGVGHDPGVGDQDVQRPVPCLDEGGDRGDVRQFEVLDAEAGVSGRRGDLGRGGSARLQVADRQRDLGAGSGQGSGRLEADAGRPTGHDRPPAGEIDPGKHFGSGGRRADRGGEAVVAHELVRFCFPAP